MHGWGSLLDKYGSVPFAELLQPAIELAGEGFPVIENTGREWQKLEGKLGATPEASEQYLIHGKAPGVGSAFRQPNLARTLGKIAKGGAESILPRGDRREDSSMFGETW
jgi:gamma-glutamyltranspeptidase/glutathione hydrolase